MPQTPGNSAAITTRKSSCKRIANRRHASPGSDCRAAMDPGNRNSSQARLQVGDFAFDVFELTIEHPAVVGVSGMVDAAPNVAGVQLQSFDPCDRFSFGNVHLAHSILRMIRHWGLYRS